MAASDALSKVGGEIFGNIFGGAALVIIAIVAIGIIGFIMWYFMVYRKKFNMTVKVMSERASDPRIFFDKGAILTDRKNKDKYFRLLNTKVNMPSPPFKIIEPTNHGDYLEVYRKSEDDFAFLTRPHIDKEKIIRADGKAYPIARTKQRQLETDAYWFMSRKEKDQKLINPVTLWSKLIEWGPQLISGFFMFIILWIFMTKLPPLIDSLTELAGNLNSITTAQVVQGIWLAIM